MPVTAFRALNLTVFSRSFVVVVQPYFRSVRSPVSARSFDRTYSFFQSAFFARYSSVTDFPQSSLKLKMAPKRKAPQAKQTKIVKESETKPDDADEPEVPVTKVRATGKKAKLDANDVKEAVSTKDKKEPASKKQGKPTKEEESSEEEITAPEKNSVKEHDISDDNESVESKENDKKAVANSTKTGGKPTKAKESSKQEKTSSQKNSVKEHDISDDNDSVESEENDSKAVANQTKKRGRVAEKESSDQSNKKSKVVENKEKTDSKPKLNRTDSNFDDIEFDSAAKTKDGKKWNFKISSWNVAGLKAWIKKNGLDFIKHENPDIICLQETKCSEKKLPAEAKVPGYHTYWLSGEKEGYAGVALLSKEKPIKVEYGVGNKEFDCDGRLITAEFEKFYLVAVYVPNAGQKLKTLPRRMEWDPLFRAHLKKLDDKKPVILCGDLNVAHNEIDLANPKTNTRSAGFTQEERDGLTTLLKEGFVDTYRHLYPEKAGAYTFWTYMSNARARNTGWRLDYFILSERLLPSVCDNVIRKDVFGSDHCPVTLFVHI